MPGNPDLRPTPDRVRETLFNWLQPVIAGANCLDLFAGSGALGFEALSRGAARVTLVEQDKAGVAALVEHARVLGSTGHNIVCADALAYLAEVTEQFDLVFLDPPFAKNLLQSTCETLLNRGHLRPDARLYVESNSEVAMTEPFTILQKAKAGQVHYMLLQNSPEGDI